MGVFIEKYSVIRDFQIFQVFLEQISINSGH